VKLTLLEATPNILVGVDAELAARARRKLERKGIELRTQARVREVGPQHVKLRSGERMETGLVIWTAGVRANLVLDSLRVKKNRSGRLEVTPKLHLRDYPQVFAIGDNAVIRGAPPEHTLQIAPVALAQARRAADNVARALSGEALVDFTFEPSGMLVSLGMNDAVIQVKGVRLGGYFAWLFWNAVHLLRMVGLKKQVQVVLDWSLATIFPRDTSIVRRPARCRLCQPNERPRLHRQPASS
jgi:NADH dehydrogenase